MSDLAGRVPLYQRLPEIHRIRDGQQTPPDQLKAYLHAVEQALGGIHENIEALYNDFFIDTCDDWVIPYIADLLGTSHLKGPAWTLRADVADTVALRRRKGTLGAIERLTGKLTGWPARAIELYANLAWSQHLNHQRPDRGGVVALADPPPTRFDVRRGGTAPIRDPAMLALRGTPFDPFAYTPDVKRADDGACHINLPNLAVFVWRLAGYRLPLTRPLAKGFANLGPPPAGSGLARFAVRFDIDPLDRPVRLFNTYRRPEATGAGNAQALTAADAVPGPIIDARLSSEKQAGNPAAYIAVDSFDATASPPTGFDLAEIGLQLYLPEQPFAGAVWSFRGDNLCAWEDGLRRPLRAGEIVIDPDIGRVLFGVASAAERNALMRTVGGQPQARIFTGYTYAAVGPVGAHPVSRKAPSAVIADAPVELRPVAALGGPTLPSALANLNSASAPVVVEIRDSMVHDLDLASLPGAVSEAGLVSLRLRHPLVIRAAAGHRPVIRLANPLAFRPTDPGADWVRKLSVRLEGVHLARGSAFTAADGALVARAAVARLELDGVSLDPGGHRLRDGSRAPMATAITLANGYGFAAAADQDAFEPTPDIVIQRSVTGTLRIDDGYRLVIAQSIVDAGREVGDVAGDAFAVTAAADPLNGWAARASVDAVTFFGRVRVKSASGCGGIFIHALEVLDNQHGCLKHCYLGGVGDRLPPHHACVEGPGVQLAFTATWFGAPGYGQLTRTTDQRIRKRGPHDDQMGAFGPLLEEHKLTNLGIRLREFMPVGIRPLLLLVT
jgi:hypothetical protein